ncbi:2-methylaconitate cis-trans isomerase PrpF family protein [Sabulicella rubraurantiaca]|uniref:2-methylaconitate cis-trans isomerase PrpF family protein n=1 Tax=Sabulicella rubraurantiaca TaxID=2811429 RepID=UPI001A961876|nr:PrpF domain-containing protein [Sabulicella rubraurantiaca]
MSQRFIPAVFMRGGSSKGVFFHARDLPESREEQAAIFLRVLGSPDPNGRQLDGMGGGISSLSKAVIIGPPTHPEADLDYTFAQVSVDRPVVDWGANCGNLSSAVGPFAVDEGLVRVADGEALVRIHQVNTRRIIHARFPVQDGRAVVAGDFTIAGVSGSGARIRLDFLHPGGATTGRLLPSGAVAEEIEGVRMTLVDAANAVAFADARDFGLSGAEAPEAIEANTALMARLDRLRRLAGMRMGLGATPEAVGLANPKIALVAPPREFRALDGTALDAASHEITVRMLSMERVHRAVPLTGGLCLGVACRLPGSVPHAAASRPAREEEIRVANPSGVLSVGAEVAEGEARSGVVFRTARRLMQGAVALP